MRIDIADLKHRCIICSLKDIVVNGAEILLARKEAYEGWAKIEAKAPSTYAPQGVTVGESRDRYNHIIYMRYRYDVEISSAAWLYEKRLKSAPRLFKIISVIEDGEWFKFYCRLTERGDNITPPVADEPEKPGIVHVDI